MTTEPVRDDQRAGTIETRHVTGRFRYDLAAGDWWWSAETYRVHGFEPGDVVPTTALVLAHKHPSDRERVRQILERAMATGELFSSVHRIMDAHGRERTIALVGEGMHDPATHELTELVGYFVDVTHATNRLADERATESIRASAANRATIEQAKGIVGFALGTDIDGAFTWLRHASNQLNVPLRELALTIVEQSACRGRDSSAIVATLLGLR